MKQVSIEKKIEDYLHLYIGCEAVVDYHENKKEGVCIDAITGMDGKYLFTTNGETFLHKKVKPILRPLSDMTEEEKTEIAKQWTWYEEMQIVGEQHFNIRHEINHQMVEKALDFTNEDDGDRMSPLAYYQVLPYLLKHGFDLFGLIESGLAIDKTKL